MRIALCLSGQPRFVSEGYNKVHKPFIKGDYDIDTFIHSWIITKEQIGTRWINAGGHPGDDIKENTMREYLDTYEPLVVELDPQREYEFGLYSDRTAPGIRSDYGASMLYSMYASNKLKSDYEKENDFKYDVVIRSRSDFQCFEPIYYERYDLNTITVPTGCPHPKGLADSFAFGSSKNMDIYNDLYNTWKTLMDKNKDQRLCWEELLWIHLENNNVEFNKLIKHRLYR